MTVICMQLIAVYYRFTFRMQRHYTEMESDRKKNNNEYKHVFLHQIHTLGIDSYAKDESK